MDERFRITGFYNVLKTRNETGEAFFMKDRYASAFIILASGQVRFSAADGTVLLCDAGHPVYLPCGLSYKNECLSAADGYLFNFFDNGTQAVPTVLSAIDSETARGFFDRMEQTVRQESRRDLEQLSRLYALAALLCTPEAPALPPLLTGAARYMAEHFDDPHLQISQVAAAIPVSAVYLRRMFLRHLKISPYRYLTGLRMEKAHAYLLENRTVTETAELCGYADIYSFSRAFKQYFGYSPSVKKR